MRRKALVLILATLSVLLCALLRLSQTTEPAPIVLEPQGLYGERELRMPSPESRTRRSRAVARTVEAVSPAEATTTQSAPLEPNAIEVSGRVLEDGSLRPLDGYRVSFTSSRDPNSAKPPTVKALTDSRGRFHASLDGSEWSLDVVCPVVIEDRAHTNVYRGVVALEHEHTFLIEPVLQVHGRLIVNREVDFTKIWMQICSAAPIDAVEHSYVPKFGASALLAADGQFHFSFVPPRRTDQFRLTFTYDGTPFHCALAAAADLTSPEGATIRCLLGDVRLTIVDENARPIEGAEARVQSNGLVHAEDGWKSQTDPRGHVEFLLGEGTFEICAGKQGFVPEHFSCAVSTNAETLERTVVLTSLRQGDEIAGVVLSPQDAPVRNAVVTVEPSTGQTGIGMAGYVQTRTDANGRFRLPVRLGSEILIVAYHRDYGTTPEFPITAQRAPIELRFEALGTVELHLRGKLPDDTAFAEPIEYALLDERRDRSFVGSEYSAPIVIEEIPAGEYMAVVRLKGVSGYGSAQVTVEAGTTRRVDVALAPSSTFIGSVARTSGTAARDIVATLHHPLWLHELEAWGRSRTDADGRFSIFGGDLARGEISFGEGSRTVARAQALEDVPLLVRIDG